MLVRNRMGKYTEMAEHYDTIVLSGYYDYDSVVESLEALHYGSNLLEIGCGTGLILEKLAQKDSLRSLTGIDFTDSMLDIAKKRLKKHRQVQLFSQNVVSLQLPAQYSTAFSWGGAWYFSRKNKQLNFISHLQEQIENERGIENISNHIIPGGYLLLGIQGPHYDYSEPVSNGMTYSQRIFSERDGFIKEYYMLDGEKVVMSQSIHYRMYSFEESVQMLSRYGLLYQPAKKTHKDELFLVFKKV